MKIVTVLILLAIQSLASANPNKGGVINCSNGTVDQVGDALFKVDAYEDAIVVSEYEASFMLDNRRAGRTPVRMEWLDCGL